MIASELGADGSLTPAPALARALARAAVRWRGFACIGWRICKCGAERCGKPWRIKTAYLAQAAPQAQKVVHQ